jgi:SAM-dependent methyltransferase
MASSDDAREPSYIPAGRSAEVEGARLAAMAALFDPFTVGCLEAIGVSPGWHCWEVGAGGGSIARWLAERVGEAGHVLATDIDLRFLQEIRHPRLEVRRHDVVTEEPPGDGFNLVHARLVLGWLPARDAVLPRLAATLRHGGWLLVEDFGGVAPPSSPPSPLLDKVQAAIEALMDIVGFDTRYGGRVLGGMHAAGLVTLGGRGQEALLPGGDPLLNGVAGTVAALGPRLVAAGLVSEQEITDCLALFADPDHFFRTARLVSAWGRRPG